MYDVDDILSLFIINFYLKNHSLLSVFYHESWIMMFYGDFRDAMMVHGMR